MKTKEKIQTQTSASCFQKLVFMVVVVFFQRINENRVNEKDLETFKFEVLNSPGGKLDWND